MMCTGSFEIKSKLIGYIYFDDRKQFYEANCWNQITFLGMINQNL